MLALILQNNNMNGEQIIPPITDPPRPNWEQSYRQYIELDNTHALMSEQIFKRLPVYSFIIPSGRCKGKIWKEFENNKWYLVWLDTDEDPDFLFIEKREILITQF